jgi:molybdate transport system substrate-binding protein
MNKNAFAGNVGARVAASFTLLAALFTGANAAGAAEIRVLSAAGMGPALKEIAGEFERVSGHQLLMEFATAGAITKRVMGGEVADVVIVTAPQLAGLVKEGKVQAGSATPVAKSGVGIAVKSGSRKPRVASVEDFKKALLGAKTVVYADPAGGGAAGIHVGGLIQKLGIAEQLKPKTRLAKGGDISEVTAAQPDGVIGMTQISEIVGKPGVELVGPLPEEVQLYTTFAVGAATGAKQAGAANAFIKFLKGPAATAAIKAKGMQAG